MLKLVFSRKYKKQWMVATFLCVWALLFIGISSFKEYELARESALTEGKNLTLVLEQHTAATFEKLDLLLRQSQALFEFNSGPLRSPKELSLALRKIKDELPAAEIVAAAGPDGYDIANSAWVSQTDHSFHSEKIFVGDRAYFKALKEKTSDDLIISEPLTSRTTGNSVVALIRRIPAKDGKFAGIVFATLNLQTFSNFFATLNPGPHGNVSLFNRDRILMARYPFLPEEIGRPQVRAFSEVINAIQSGKTQGVYFAASAFEPVTKLFTFQVVSGWPLVVQVGKAERDIMELWWRQQRNTGLLSLFFIGSVIVGMYFYLLRREESEEQKAIVLQAMKMSTLGEMASGIAHEINNPLAVMMGNAKIIMNRLQSGNFDSTELHTMAKKIDEMGERVIKIIRGLRSFTRNSAGDPMEDIVLGEIISSMRELTLSRIAEIQGRLQTDTIPDIQLHCREVQITQVLVNLINNAVDAIRNLDERWIRIEFSKQERFFCIRVVDSGSGIPEDVAKNLMKPFFTTKPTNEGTGLGLNISMRILHEHGGRLWLDRDCKNTCFVVELPYLVNRSV